MMAATLGSAILGMWDEAAFLVFLYGAAEGLEEYTYAKTRHSIRKLLDLAPKEARVLKDGREITIPAERLNVGDVFIVRPGESLPTDGVTVKTRATNRSSQHRNLQLCKIDAAAVSSKNHRVKQPVFHYSVI